MGATYYTRAFSFVKCSKSYDYQSMFKSYFLAGYTLGLCDELTYLLIWNLSYLNTIKIFMINYSNYYKGQLCNLIEVLIIATMIIILYECIKLTCIS